MGCHCHCKGCKHDRKKLKHEAICELAHHHFEYRDDSPNNVEHPTWGEPGQNLLRGAEAQYTDGISTPAGESRPSAREVSNVIFAQHEAHPNEKNASAIFWLWGQFLDHDIGLTEQSHDPVEPFNIAVPSGDPHFDPEGTGTVELSLNRSKFDHATGTNLANPRQQINETSPFIDASMVYGNTPKRSEWLRTGHDGLLNTSMGKMMPYNDGKMNNAMGKSSAFYVGGDVRANEHLGLTAMHTIWVREHNYWAKKLHHKHPKMGDEELYQRARVLVEAEIQAITINEFLPLLLGGKEVFGKYEGYDPEANPQMKNEFTTAAYRLGHTLVSKPYPRLEENGHHINDMELMLRGAFFCPWVLTNEGGVDPVIRGLATVVAEEFDGKVIDDLRNFLFVGEAGPHGKGLDLTAFNIQRGRDHGLADYNATREAYGLPAVTSFSEVISDPTVVEKMVLLYGTPDQADLYVTLQVEDHFTLEGGGKSMLGPTTMAILGEQATRMRAGDRFWYQRRLPKKLLKFVETVTLSQVILRNTDIESIQDDIMIAEPRPEEHKCKKK